MSEQFECDLCKKEKSLNNTYPDHFSGYINGNFSQHIHVCEDCIKEYDIEYLDITTSDSSLYNYKQKRIPFGEEILYKKEIKRELKPPFPS